MADKVKLTIEFKNEKIAKNFALWLCNHGEQEYWSFIDNLRFEEPEAEEAYFNYHNTQEDDEGKKVYGPFMKDLVIRSK